MTEREGEREREREREERERESGVYSITAPLVFSLAAYAGRSARGDQLEDFSSDLHSHRLWQENSLALTSSQVESV